MHQEFALEQLVSVDKLFKNTTLTDNGKALVKIAGGHSRTLQNVKTVLEKNSQEDRLPELLTLLDREQNKSLDNLEDAKPLLRSSVTGTPVSRRQPLVNYGGVTLTTDEVRAHGFCAFLRVIDEPFRMIPVITPYRLSKYFQKMNEVLGNQFRDSFCSRSDQHNFGGIDFGKFHSSFECFRRMLWTDASLGRVKTASIKDVYQTGETLFSKDFQNTLIRLPETYVLKEALSQTFHEYVESGGSLYGDKFVCFSFPKSMLT